MITCQIQWIDKYGNPTPDDNPAVCIVSCKTSDSVKAFFCCAEHRKRAVGFPNWSIHEPANFSKEFIPIKR